MAHVWNILQGVQPATFVWQEASSKSCWYRFYSGAAGVRRLGRRCQHVWWLGRPRGINGRDKNHRQRPTNDDEMPLYIHTCLSEVSGIAMMINCIISVVFGLWGNKDGTNTSDEELAQVPWMFKYFRSFVLTVSIGYNTSRFVFECTRGDVMLITVLFRAVLDGLQLAEHLYLCQNYNRFFVLQEAADFFWTRGLISLSVFCGLGIFSGLEGVNGSGKAMLEHILWSLTLALLIAGGLVWGRWQDGGITRAKVSNWPPTTSISISYRDHTLFLTHRLASSALVCGEPGGVRSLLPGDVPPHRGG